MVKGICWYHAFPRHQDRSELQTVLRYPNILAVICAQQPYCSLTSNLAAAMEHPLRSLRVVRATPLGTGHHQAPLRFSPLVVSNQDVSSDEFGEPIEL